MSRATAFVDEVANELDTWPGVRIERRGDGAAVVFYERLVLGILDRGRGLAELGVSHPEHDDLIEHGDTKADPSRPYADAVSHDLRGPSDVTAVLDLFDRQFTLMRFDPSADDGGLAEASSARGVPLQVVDVDDPAIARLYECPLVLVRPDDAEALAWGILAAAGAGPVSPAARHEAGARFTVAQSVDALLNVFARPLPIPPAVIVRRLEELIAAPSALVTRAPNPGGALAGTLP